MLYQLHHCATTTKTVPLLLFLNLIYLFITIIINKQMMFLPLPLQQLLLPLNIDVFLAVFLQQ